MVRRKYEPTEYLVTGIKYSNTDYELVYKDKAYAVVQLQHNIAEKWAYIHFNFEKFTIEIAKVVKDDWLCLQMIAKTQGVEKFVGMNDSNIKKWHKFLKLIDSDNTEDIVLNNKPLTIAIMEL